MAFTTPLLLTSTSTTLSSTSTSDCLHGPVPTRALSNTLRLLEGQSTITDIGHTRSLSQQHVAMAEDCHNCEETLKLRCRTVQLETEIRIVKEQCAQAQSGGVLVVSLLSSTAFNTQAIASAQHSSPPNTKATDTITLHCNIAALETELHFAKQQLAAAQSGGAYLINLLGSHASLFRPAQPLGHPLSDRLLYGDSGSAPQTSNSLLDDDSELLPFSGWTARPRDSSDLAGSSSTIKGDNDVPRSSAPSMQPDGRGVNYEVDADPFGLGVKGVTYPPSPPRTPLLVAEPVRPSDGHEMIASNGQKVTFSVPEAQSASPTSYPRRVYHDPPTIQQKPINRFHDHEHGRLRGVAYLVDEYKGSELDEFWADYAEEHSRHSAGEWREYYVANIQPRFREEKARRAAEEAAEKRATKREEESKRLLLSNAELETGDLLGDEVICEEAVTAAGDLVLPEKSEQDNADALEVITATEVQICEVVNATPDTDLQIDVETKPTEEQESARPAPQGLAVSMHAPPMFDAVAQMTNATGVPFLRGSEAQLNEARAFLQAATRGGGRRSNDRQRDHGQSRNHNIPSRHSPSRVMAAKTDLPRKLDAAALQAVTLNESKWSRIWDEDTIRMVCYEYIGSGLSKDPTKRRTVLIQDVPDNISLAEVLDNVRGGRIINARFAVTKLMKTTPAMGNTVIVEFQGSTNAQKFVQSCEKYPVLFKNAKGEQVKALVNLIETPTRPIHWTIVKGMRDDNVTRVVYLFRDCKLMTSDDVVDKVLAANPCIAAPLKADFDDDGLLLLQFANIIDAGNAWVVLKKLPVFKNMQKGFMADLCAMSLLGGGIDEGADGEEGKGPGDKVEEPVARVEVSGAGQAGVKAEVAIPQLSQVVKASVDGSGVATIDSVADSGLRPAVADPSEIDLVGLLDD